MRRKYFALGLGLVAGAMAAVWIVAANWTTKATISGTVTVDGKKLAEGYITFYPATASGAAQAALAETRGTEIHDGCYTIAGLSPGKRKIVVAVLPKLSVVKAAGPSKSTIIAARPDNFIPPTAPGNSQIVDIPSGTQSIDVTLKRR